jgi:hypothetical protein
MGTAAAHMGAGGMGMEEAHNPYLGPKLSTEQAPCVGRTGLGLGHTLATSV